MKAMALRIPDGLAVSCRKTPQRVALLAKELNHPGEPAILLALPPPARRFAEHSKECDPPYLFNNPLATDPYWHGRKPVDF